MPIYEYTCERCGHRFERLMRLGEAPPDCPGCGAVEVRKLVSAAAFVLKGSGWYKDHYGLKRSSGGSEASTASSSGSSSDGGSSSAGSPSGTSSPGSGPAASTSHAPAA